MVRVADRQWRDRPDEGEDELVGTAGVDNFEKKIAVEPDGVGSVSDAFQSSSPQ